MLNVVICEDNNAERVSIENIIKKIILIENFDMKISLGTTDPVKVLDYLRNERATGLYFLDVDLKSDINGIELAETIREYDPRGFIVIITAYPETLPIILKYKIEPLEFIDKRNFLDIRVDIENCVRLAHKRHTSHTAIRHNVLSVKLNDQITTVAYDEIISIETSPGNNNHMLILHTTGRRLMFTGYLKDVENRLDARFIRISQSYIINVSHIKNFKPSSRELLMSDGRTFTVPIKKIREVKRLIQHMVHAPPYGGFFEY